MRLPAAFEEFCQFLRVEKEAAPRTIMTYRSRFEDFLQFARTENSALMVSQFTATLCRSYQYALDKRELAPATVRGRLAMLSSFGEWLVLRDRLPRNPIDQLTRPRLKDHLPRVPKWSFVEGLVSNGLGLREKAIVALLSYGGLRRAEVVALDVGDFDPEFGLRRVRGKGNRDEAVALPELACRPIAEYLEAERPGARPEAPMFVARYLSRGGKSFVGRMVDGRIYKIIRAIGKRHGAEGLHPHALRHACGVELLEISGGNLREVQEHLRHRDIQTTTIYTRISKPKLKKTVSLFDRGSRP